MHSQEVVDASRFFSILEIFQFPKVLSARAELRRIQNKRSVFKDICRFKGNSQIATYIYSHIYIAARKVFSFRTDVICLNGPSKWSVWILKYCDASLIYQHMPASHRMLMPFRTDAEAESQDWWSKSEIRPWLDVEHLGGKTHTVLMSLLFQ